MDKLSPIKVGIALALLVIVNPAKSDDKCRTGCHGASSNIFKYAEGTTYKYNLEGNVDITLSSAEGQISTTKLKATVLLTQLPQCNQLLRLQNVQVFGADGKKYSNIPNIDKPVQINFQDGKIEDQICATKGDTQVSLNIKRAVASMFQASTKQQYETDVFGVCRNDISTRKEGGNVVVITKHKNLNKCSFREHVKQDFMATSFNLNSEIKSSPILNSDYTSEQKVKNGILDSAVVTEKYLYVPFSVGKDGAKATVTTRLQLAGQSKENPKTNVNEVKPILFENPHYTTSEKTNPSVILNAIKDTVKTVKESVGETTAKEFINLIKIMRASKKSDLLAVFNQVKTGAGFSDKTIGKKIFFEALFKAGTGETVEVSIELLKNKEIECKLQQKMVYLGLAFVRHATPESILTAMTLLDGKDVPREAYLGIGSLAGHYCRQHSNCAKEDAIKKLTAKFASKLDSKAPNKNQENELISILKGIANMDHVEDSLVGKIVGIANNKNLPYRLRVAALEAYMADPCKEKFRDTALNILKDIQQDSEVRIKAYLAAAQCPNAKVAKALKTLLDDEPSYQVGGFIISHLKNLKASTNPSKQLAKEQLRLVPTTKKYPIDFRRYSHNLEFSYSADTLGLGSTTEANVIYSQNSFLPRSTSLNLTAEVFGHSFNFLEVSTRQENLDRVLEEYFAPLAYKMDKSSKRQEEVKEKVKTFFDHLNSRYEKTFGKSTKTKRDVSKAEIDSIGKQVQIKTNELNKDLDLDLSIKILGSEISFFSLTDNAEEYKPNAVVDKVFDYLDEGIRQLKNFDRSYVTNNMFLDAELAYPTSTGFPLKLSIDGAMSSKIQTSGKLDLISYFSVKEGVDPPLAKLSFVPSTNIEVAGKLTIDAHFVENGLKVASTLYASTGGAAEIEVYESKKTGYDVKYRLPLQKQQISANHEIVFNTRELGMKEVDQKLKFPQAKDFEVCADQVSKLIGLTFCAEINSPNNANQNIMLPFPLDGHSKLGISIIKEDLKEYHVRRVSHTDPNVQHDFLYEVLGEKETKLQLAGQFRVSPDLYFKLSAMAFNSKGLLEGRMVDEAKEKSIYVQLVQDDNILYLAQLGYTVEGQGKKSTLTPVFKYKYPNMAGDPYKLAGTITLEKTPKDSTYTFDSLKLITPDKKDITLKGKVIFGVQKYSVDVSLGDGTNTGTFKGNLELKPDGSIVAAEFTNSFNPANNFKLDYLLKAAGSKYKSDLALTHGKDLSSKQNTFKLLNNLVISGGEDEETTYETKNSLTYPAAGWNHKLDALDGPKEISYDILFKSNDVNLGSKMNLKYDQKVENDYDFLLNVQLIKNKYELISKRTIKGKKSDIINSVNLNGKKFELKGLVTHDFDDHTNFGLDLILTAPIYKDPIKLNQGLVIKEHNFDAHLKLTSGSVQFIDNSLKIDDAGNANGVIKVNFKDTFTANGQIKANKGKGNADVVWHFVKTNRKIKLESTYNIADPIYNIEATLYTDFEKNNKQKYVLSTQNKIEEENWESKNTIDIEGNKVEGNFKLNNQGNVMNGKQKGEVEFSFYNEIYLAGKLNREMKMTEEEVMNGNVNLNVEYGKNKKDVKFKGSFKGVIVNTDIDDGIFDLTYNVALQGQGKETLNGDFVFKRILKKEDQYVVDVKTKLYGSILPNTFDSNLHAEYANYIGNYKGVVKYGPKTSLNVQGKYDFKMEDTPINNEVSIEFYNPGPSFSTVKFHSSGLVGVKTVKNLIFELKGDVSLLIDHSGTPDQSLDIKYSGDIKVGEKDANIKSTLKYQKEEPISFALNYVDSGKGDLMQLKGSGSLQYGKDQSIKSDFNIVEASADEVTINVAVNTPGENVKNTNLQLHLKSNSKEEKEHVDSKLTVDGKTYEFIGDVQTSEITPSAVIVLKYPDGKSDELTIKVKKANANEFAGDFKIIAASIYFDLVSSIDSQVKSIDDFQIKVNADSKSLKLNKVIFEAVNKGGKGGKKIQFNAKSADKNILSGSTTYKTREEGGKFIIEGSGSFKVNEESKSANFKYSSQMLTNEKHGETGVEHSFDATLGNKAIDAELKYSNKQFRFHNSYCEEKKQCAHIEIDSKVSVEQKGNEAEYHYELLINSDLRKLGLSHEFGLKSVTVIGSMFDHTVDVHFQNQQDSKYQYSLYMHPTKAGASLTTPKRVVSLESNVVPVKTQGPVTEAKGEIVFYLDKKNKPKEKTIFSYHATTNVDKTKGSSSHGVKFSTPGLGKSLVLSLDTKLSGNDCEFEGVIDLFAKPNQKIIYNGKSKAEWKDDHTYSFTAQFTAKSTGLNFEVKADESIFTCTKSKIFKYNYNLDYHIDKIKSNSALKLESQPDHFVAYSKLFNKELVSVETKGVKNKETYVADSTISFYGVKPTVTHAEVSANVVKYSVASKEKPNDKLQLTYGFVPGNIADARAEIFKGGKPNELYHYTLKLDEANFLKSDYAIRYENVKNMLLSPVQEGLKKMIHEQNQAIQNIAQEAQSHMKYAGEVAKKHSPNMKSTQEYYTNELHKIQQEFVADKSISKAVEFLDQVFGAYIKAAAEITKKLIEVVDVLWNAAVTNYIQLNEVLTKDVLPKFLNASKQIVSLFGQIFESFTNVIITVLAKASEFLNSHQEDFKQLAESFGSVAQDVVQAAEKSFNEIKMIIEQQVKEMYEELKALPILKEAKEKFDTLMQSIDVSEAGLNLFKEFVATIQDIVPCEDVRKLLQDISDYLEKKINKEPVNDQEAFKVISQDITNILKLVPAVFDDREGVMFKQNILNLDYLTKLPQLEMVKVSLLNRLNDELPSPWQILAGVSFNPMLWIPPYQFQAMVVQGQHIFTFDGKHLTFPGKCNYLLSRDALNGNFTIIAKLDNGVLTAITFNDKTDTVTIKKGGQVLVNKVASEYPVVKPDLRVKQKNSVIKIQSSAGVRINCDVTLQGCEFIVSGFYHGQLKGLLGNGNNEPYDDFTLPNGKIVSGEGEFGNAYKTQSNCPAVKTVDHKHHHRTKECDKYFNDDSGLSLCYEFIKPDNFKMACEHGIAGSIKDTVPFIVGAYASACNFRGIPINIPDEFLKCKNGEKPRELGSSFSLKTPGKAADIVIVVDVAKTAESTIKELIQPMVNELNKELNGKGINDIEYHFIGYGDGFGGPYHYTVEGKSTSKGKLPDFKLLNPKGPKDVDPFKIDPLYDFLVAIGLDPQSKAYYSAINYPFRAHAVKTVIAVTGNPCHHGLFFPLQIVRAFASDPEGIFLNLITPHDDDFQVKDEKTTNNVIGFNDENVFTFTEAKKNPDGTPTLHGSIEQEDYCVEYITENKGNVFILDNFQKAKPAQKKLFVNVATHNIARQMTTTEKGFDCTCRRVSFYEAKNECSEVYSKTKISKKN